MTTATLSPTTIDQLKPGDHFISITSGMRGYFAVMLWINNEQGNDDTFVEPVQSFDWARSTADAAEHDARTWAEAEGLPFIAAQH